MSAALVRKSLAIVDPDFDQTCSRKSNKKSHGERITNLMHEKHRLTEKLRKKKQKGKNVHVLQGSKKITVAEARKNHISKNNILKENLKKLKLIKEVCTINLDDEVSKQFIERAVTRRPIKIKGKSKKQQKTAFTKEDFDKFEAEYFDE